MNENLRRSGLFLRTHVLPALYQADLDEKILRFDQPVTPDDGTPRGRAPMPWCTVDMDNGEIYRIQVTRERGRT